MAVLVDNESTHLECRDCGVTAVTKGKSTPYEPCNNAFPCGIPNLMDKTEGPTSQSRSGQITNCNTTLLETICDDGMWCESGSVFPSYVECRRFQALYEVLKRIPETSYQKIRDQEFHWFVAPDPRMPERRLRLRAFSMS